MSARLAALVFAIVAFAVGGCTYNPGQFPFVLPPGNIKQTHAKPRFGYFHDYDPKAQRLVVKPNDQANAPINSQIVLVAAVYDKDGLPRRDRRVEWMLEGPGNIIEADESGVSAGRGYKVDNKYAVTYTSYVPHKMTRGNTDAADDTVLEAGQTFIVITSAVPGETVVTAYAPEVFNWDNRRVVTKVLWGDARFSFPAPVAVRVGSETTLATSVNLNASDAQSGYRIRYRVIDGPAAVLVARGDSASATSLTGSGGKEAETVTDSNGQAAVRLVERDPQLGKTHVAVEVLKPPENGVGPGTVVGRRETVVEWTTPEVRLRIDTPTAASSLGTFPATVSLVNVSGVDTKDARIRVTLSNGAVLSRSEPPPTSVDAKGGLLFDLPPVIGKGKQDVTLQVKPAGLGSVTITAEAVTGDGLQANTMRRHADRQRQTADVTGSPAARAGGRRIPVRIAVTNSGAAPVDHLTVWARFDNGLTPLGDQAARRSPGDPVELAGGTIAPGETKTFDLPLSAKTTGRYGVRASVTGDGNLSAAADPLSVEIRRAELVVALAGPKIAYLDQEVDWSISVANRGDSSISGVVVRATLPPELEITAADGGAIGPGSVEWKLDALKSGELKSFKLTGNAIKLTTQANVAVAALGDAETSNGQTVGTPVQGKADATLAVIGTPVLSLQLATPPGVVEVGSRAALPDSREERGDGPGTENRRGGVRVARIAAGERHGRREGRVDATGRVAFPTVEELQPGQTLTFTVEVDAAKTGDARFRAEVAAAHLKNSLKEEQATRITGR